MGIAERLQQKGWSAVEIQHTVQKLNVAEKKMHPFTRFTTQSSYWIFLMSLTVSIIALVEFVFPLLVLLPDSLSYFVLVLVGFIFGALFANVLHRMDSLHDAHHTIVLFTATSATLVASWVLLGGELLFGLVFVLAFAMLYCYYWWRR